jgi:hypothetical protein
VIVVIPALHAAVVAMNLHVSALIHALVKLNAQSAEL